MTYEEITVGHIREWGDLTEVSDDLIAGFAARDSDGELCALFCAFPCEDRWWVAFDRNENCQRAVFKQLVRGLDALAAVEIDGERPIKEVWALCDETKPRARELMEFLGFVLQSEGAWVLDISDRNRAIGS